MLPCSTDHSLLPNSLPSVCQYLIGEYRKVFFVATNPPDICYNCRDSLFPRDLIRRKSVEDDAVVVAVVVVVVARLALPIHALSDISVVSFEPYIL